MSCPEMSLIYDALHAHNRNHFNNFVHQLQSRYGDPRVYESQQREMRRQEAAVVFDQQKARSELLLDAYKKQTERNRANHEQRIKNLQSRAGSKRPQSLAAASTRTPAPPPASTSVPAPSPASAPAPP